jgi:hypothetical protein
VIMTLPSSRQRIEAEGYAGALSLNRAGRRIVAPAGTAGRKCGSGSCVCMSVPARAGQGAGAEAAAPWAVGAEAGVEQAKSAEQASSRIARFMRIIPIATHRL